MYCTVGNFSKAWMSIKSANCYLLPRFFDSSVGFILLPIGEPDSEERLEEIASRMQKLYRSRIVLSNHFQLRVIGSMPLPLVRFCRKRSRPSPIMVCNWVGPPEALYWEESQISDVKIVVNIPFNKPKGNDTYN